MRIFVSKEFSLRGKENHCFNPFIKTMHTSKSSEKYLFAGFDNLDLRSSSSHMISQFWLKPSLSTVDMLKWCKFNSFAHKQKSPLINKRQPTWISGRHIVLPN
jgi:hypothetical protein